MVALKFHWGRTRGQGFATATLSDGQKLGLQISNGEKGYVAILTFVGKHKSVSHPQMNGTKVLTASKRSELIARIEKVFN